MKQKLLSILFLLTCTVGYTFAQSGQVTGKVTDSKGSALPGVTVISEGASSASQTDNFGHYETTGERGKKLTFKLIGYLEKTITISSTTVDVQLEMSDIGLDEVVVTAYGVQNKEAITGAVVSVSAKEIEKRPVSSVTAVLEGTAPGIQVNNSYGEPGSSPDIQVRGFGSVNKSSSPVYVVDGVIFGGNISDLNPSDIESVSVLKDATSATLYGNRGANGVIVITTKKGNTGQPELSILANVGTFSRGIPEYDKLDAKQFMEASWQGYRNQLLTANSSWTLEQANAAANSGIISSVLKTNIFSVDDDKLFDANGKLNPEASIKAGYSDDLDWFDPITRNGLRQDYGLSGKGGSEKSRYFFSTNYLSEDGYIKYSNFDRLSARLNGDLTPRSWLKLGMSMNASHQLSNSTNGEGSGYTNPWMYARSIAPIYAIHEHDPVTGEYILDATQNKIYDDGALSRNQYVGRHMIWENELNENKGKRNTLNSQAFMNVKFLKNFSFDVLGDINLRYDETRTYNNAIIGDGAGNNGRASRTIYNYKNYTFQQLLNYNNSINGVHNIDAMLGHENYGNIYTYLYGYKTTETFAGQNHLANFNNITNLTDYEQNDKTESYFGRFRYNYDQKYYVEGSIRRDGSSRVASENRWANFWSLGGTWMLSKEKFLEDVSWINSLKIRAASGVVGSLVSLGFYDYMALYSLGQNSNLPALYQSNLANPDLRWEGSQSSSVALEGRLFNKLNFTVEYFDKRSKDLLFDVNIPLSTGSTETDGTAFITRNIGDLVNKGIEVSFDVDVVKKNDFSWNIGANATFLTNKILNLPEENKKEGILSDPFKYMEGHSVFDYYLRQFAGVDMLTGQSLYFADKEAYDPTDATGAWYAYQEEINGEIYTRNSSYAKREFSGSAIPKVMGAINTNLSYKEWSLSGIFTYSIGGKGLDYSYISLMSATGPSSLHADVANSWTEAPAGMTETSADRINPNATPQINFTNSQYNNATSTRFLMDNSYFVIKNIALSYRLPKRLVERANLSRVSLILTGENLATFTKLKGYSPQQNFGGYSENEFVPARTISFGLNVGL